MSIIILLILQGNNSDETGLSAEYPYPGDTSLINFSTSESNPRLGNGLLTLLRTRKGDNDGKTAGLITSEDIFEEIFGEFEDEFDSNPIDTQEYDDGSILINGKMKWIDYKHQTRIQQGHLSGNNNCLQKNLCM